ncbi:MAG: AEC family transporter [Clostridium sp.]
MEIKEVLNSVISLFLIMLIGVYACKKGIITDELKKGLTNLLLKITQPLMILASFSFAFEEGMMANVIKAFIYSFICFIVAISVSYIFLLKMTSKKKKVLQFANVFSNCGFMGFPVIESIYGAEGVVYASIFNMFFSLFLWTYGYMLFSSGFSKEEAKKVLVNPGVVAVYIGIAMLLLKVQLPGPIYSSVKMVGSMTTPISMLIVGSILSRVDIRQAFKDWTLLYGSFLKLMIMPLCVFIMSRILKDSSIVMNTMILLQAMPAAAMTTIFAENFNNQKEYAAVLVFTTTLLSIITFPIVVLLIN